MAEAKINESCIIGLPTCGYAFSSSRMAFIAAPSDEEFALELEVLQQLLREKEYESYVALQRVEPGKFAFCTKICSKIITSQFCIVLLNPSAHHEHKDIKIPNPNVHLEYGVMMAFKKTILPLQREGSDLAFNIRPLDTIIYNPARFKEKAEQAIDGAILTAGTTSRPVRTLASSLALLRYLAVRGLRLSDVSNEEANALYQLGSTLGFNLLDGQEVVYFGMFDLEPAKEVVFRLKLLLQNLDMARKRFENELARTLPADQVERIRTLAGRLRIEVLIAKDLDKQRVEQRVRELTSSFEAIPWTLLTEDDVTARVDAEFNSIGEI